MALSTSEKDRLIQQGDEAYGHGRWLEASRRYEEIVAQQPEWPTGYHKLGRAYAERGRHRQAIEALKKAVALGVQTAAIHYELALSYRSVEEYEPALAHAERAIGFEPDNARYYDLVGQLRSDRKEYLQALGYYRQAVAKDGKFMGAYLHLAGALEALERREEALRELTRALEVNPADLDWGVLGRLLRPWEAHTDHVAEISQTLPADPLSLHIQWGATLLDIGAKDRGRDALIHALDLVCEEKDGLQAGAQNQQEEKTKERLTSLEDMVLWALERLGASLADMPDQKLCADQVTERLDRLRRPWPYTMWATFLERNHEVDGARALIGKGMECLRGAGAPEAWRAFQQMGPELVERFGDELTKAVEALDAEGTDLAWAEVLWEREKYREAEGFLRRAVGRHAELPQGYSMLAAACARQHKYDDACAAFIQALELYAQQGGAVANNVPMAEMVPVLALDRWKETQRVGELVRQLDQGALFLKWASALNELGAPHEALAQLQAAALSEQKTPEDALLDSMFFGKGDAGQDPRSDLLEQWAAFLEGRADRKGLLQLARVLRERDPRLTGVPKERNVRRALSCVRKTLEGLDDRDPLWLEAAALFGTLGAPGEAAACYRRHLGEAPEQYRTRSWYAPDHYTAWAEALVSADPAEKDVGHTALLLESTENWMDEDQRSDRAPDVNWDRLREKRKAQAARIDELVKAIQRNVDDCSVCTAVAGTLFNHHQYEAAMQVLQQARGLNPQDARTAALMGWTWCQTKMYSDARDEFRRALHLDDAWWTHWGMARAALSLNDIPAATRSYQRATELLQENPGRRFDTYLDWSWALTYAGELEGALEKAERARQEAERSPEAVDDMWAHFRLGYVYAEMRRYDDALEHYEHAIRLEDHPFPRHNIASLYQMQGKYREARALWQEACTAYRHSLAEAIRGRDSDYLFNYANVHARVLGNRSVGEMLYRIGLELDPSHTGLLMGLGRLYEDQSKRAETVEARTRLRDLARRSWSRAEAVLQERQARGADAVTLTDLGSLYLEMGDDKRARENFHRALGLRAKDPQVQAELGEAYRRAGRKPLALRHLKQAVSGAPDDLDVRAKLARVYLEDGQLVAAEAGFRDILDHRSEHHFDARVGLGEVYMGMADEREKEKDTETAIDYWRRAQGEFERAIETAQSDERPTDIPNQELASVHYLSGYCQLNQERTVSLRRLGRMRNALREFETCYDLDPTHYQAERARDMLREKTRYLPVGRSVEDPWAVLIVVIALVLLVLAQVAKFRGWREAGSPAGFRFTDATLAAIPALSQAAAQQPAVAQELTEKLRPAFDKMFADKEALLLHLNGLVGAEWVDRYGETLTAYALVPAGAQRQACLPDGYWVLMSFGAILFLIAGACLPYLTNLKAGPLQLEKKAADQVAPGGALGIPVERMRSRTANP
jgi:tetratricopeptide (TPR) repeat protein